ncbi:TPR repeat-containing protein (plasmid) [Fischerella sp. NIES-4106]|nr:TPR repeat-containing protein [Fischerella sp. NIES-4106]
MNPNFAEAYNNRGVARIKLKDYTGATEDFNQALQIERDFIQAYLNRAYRGSTLREGQA